LLDLVDRHSADDPLEKLSRGLNDGHHKTKLARCASVRCDDGPFERQTRRTLRPLRAANPDLGEGR
jgi:hypothetical protein